jgi:hypothetical protein
MARPGKSPAAPALTVFPRLVAEVILWQADLAGAPGAVLVPGCGLGLVKSGCPGIASGGGRGFILIRLEKTVDSRYNINDKQ